MRNDEIKILFVEDEEIYRKTLKRTVGRYFPNIDDCENGEIGLEHFKNQHYDIVLTDLNMPKMDGIEMAQEIRKIDKDIPIVFMTARSDEETLEMAKKIEVLEYLYKPLSIEHIIDTIKKVAEQK